LFKVWVSLFWLGLALSKVSVLSKCGTTMKIKNGDRVS
jgi:hypothetical protein